MIRLNNARSISPLLLLTVREQYEQLKLHPPDNSIFPDFGAGSAAVRSFSGISVAESIRTEIRLTLLA